LRAIRYRPHLEPGPEGPRSRGPEAGPPNW